MAAIRMIQLINLTKEYDLPSGKRGEIVAADRLNLEVPDAGRVVALDDGGSGRGGPSRASGLWAGLLQEIRAAR